MTGWIIFGCIVLFLIILFGQSVTVTFDYENKLDIKVKFLFFTIYPTKSPKRKRRKKKNLLKNQQIRQPILLKTVMPPTQETSLRRKRIRKRLMTAKRKSRKRNSLLMICR